MSTTAHSKIKGIIVRRHIEGFDWAYNLFFSFSSANTVNIQNLLRKNIYFGYGAFLPALSMVLNLKGGAVLRIITECKCFFRDHMKSEMWVYLSINPYPSKELMDKAVT